MDTVEIEAQPRQVLGKKVKLLRRQGLVPANVYGHNIESFPVQLPEKLVSQRIARASRSSLFSIKLDGSDATTVLVKELQRHPTSGRVLHVDFYQVAMTEKLRTSVPLHFVGDAPAVKQFSGSMLHNLQAVEVESLPGNLPSAIEVDVSALVTLDDAIHVQDLKAPSGVEILADPDELVAKVLPPTVAEEAPEAAPVAEGEQPAEATTQEAAEDSE